MCVCVCSPLSNPAGPRFSHLIFCLGKRTQRQTAPASPLPQHGHKPSQLPSVLRSKVIPRRWPPARETRPKRGTPRNPVAPALPRGCSGWEFGARGHQLTVPKSTGTVPVWPCHLPAAAPLPLAWGVGSPVLPLDLFPPAEEGVSYPPPSNKPLGSAGPWLRDCNPTPGPCSAARPTTAI